jgi:hypothetical protein
VWYPVRVWLLGLLAAAMWLLVRAGGQPHRVLDASAPVTAFSAVRAQAALDRLLGPQRPHPLGSAAQAAVRARIVDEFAALGIPARTYRAFTCNSWRGFARVPCGTVTDLIAEVMPGQGRAVVMLAHYDSVPAGPGAADDAAGVAAVLESARALRASGRGSLHPVIALITDGEEAGLLGAKAFLQNAALRSQVGAVVNVEARGTAGPSLLFQTSPGDARLVGLYATHVRAVAGSSLYAEIYRRLPNDTDLTLFIRDGFAGFNFAFIDGVRYYHSALDTRRHLGAASLQMQGDSLLGVVRALENTPYAALRATDAAYLSIFNSFMPRVPVGWTVPLAMAALALIALAAGWARGRPVGRMHASHRASRLLCAALMPPALMGGALLIGGALVQIARLLSGMPEAAYAHPAALRTALAFGIWTMTLLAARMGSVWATAASAWLWIGAAGVAAAVWAPGASPYFLFPALLAAPLLIGAARAPGGWNGAWGRTALLLSALTGFAVWIALAVGAEALRGFRPYPLVVIPGVLALLGLVPLLAARPAEPPGRPRGWLASVLASGALALIWALLAGVLPTYSRAAPQRLDLVYLQDPAAAMWLAEPSWEGHSTGPVPAALLQAGNFRRIQPLPMLLGGAAVSASAPGAPRLPLPTATLLRDESGHGLRRLTVRLHGSPLTDEMLLYIPPTADLRDIDLRGQHLQVPDGWSGATRLVCYGRDCRDETVTLVLAGDAPALQFAERRYALPPFGAALQAARPDTAVASQGGDETVLVNAIGLTHADRPPQAGQSRVGGPLLVQCSSGARWSRGPMCASLRTCRDRKGCRPLPHPIPNNGWSRRGELPMKFIHATAALAVLAVSPVYAACTTPAPVPAIPDAASAKPEDILSTQKAVLAFNDTTKTYLDCIKKEHDAAVAAAGPQITTVEADKIDRTEDDAHDAAVKQLNDVVGRFNTLVHDFQQKQADAAAAEKAKADAKNKKKG